MIQQSVILALALIVTLFTITNMKWSLAIGIIFISNWGYQSIQQNNEMQRKLYAIMLQKTEEEINKEYPKITLFGSSVQLGKDTIATVQSSLALLESDISLKHKGL
ncbi:MAG: hypothetical protein ACJAZS_000138 [Alteromonas naphthalenivorans]|jgi:hypothetical protein